MFSEEAIHAIVDKAKRYDELLKINETPLLTCSFCGKNQEQVEKLIAGPRVYICSSCVKLCNEIIEE